MRLSLLSLCALATTAGFLACSDDGAEDDAQACAGALCPGAPGSPQFSGVASVAPDARGERLRVTWLPATDDATPPAEITYRIYVSTYAGRATRKAAVATVSGTSAYVAVAPTGVEHFVVVRAVDGEGKEDGNTVEKSVLATPDTTPPTFGGAKAAKSAPDSSVTISWDAATDDRTPPEGMRYVVSVVDGAGGATTLAVVDGPQTEVTVPGGLAGERRRYRVNALDAADNLDANQAVIDGSAGPDADPPLFAGCDAVEILGSKIARVRWAPASDDVTPPERIVYEVFATKAGAAPDFASPTLESSGGTSAIVRGLEANQDYAFVCRARDLQGNRDANTTEKTGKTRANVSPPSFSGATGVLDPVTRAVSFTWTAATDDQTASGSIVYAVYQARGSDPFDFDAPVAVTGAGATSFVLEGVPSRSSLRWVVRARDADYNEDANRTETTGTTNTSYSLDVQPFFDKNCAVAGCHVSAAVGHGVPFSLSPFDAYARIVDVNAGQRGKDSTQYKRVAPGSSGASYLYLKMANDPNINGQPMPAPGTGTVLSAEELDIVASWIDQGAPRN